MSWIAAGVVVGGVALGAGGSLLGAGKKPKVPQFPMVDLGEAQGQAVKSNIAKFEDIAALATKANTFTADQMDALMQRALPGGKSKIQELITSQLSGEIPKDVSDSVWRSSAGQALSGGYAGSGMARNLTARDLGLTSLQISQRGFDSAQRWLAQTSTPTFDVTSMFVTPQQNAEFQFQQNQQKWNRDWMKAQVKASPDPTKAAIGGFMQQIGGMAFGAGLGGMGGMGGGGGMGAGASQYAGSRMMAPPPNNWRQYGG